MAGREGAIVTGNVQESGETDGPSVNVIVHPLVLLSTVDHYTRVAKDTKKRVVGVLLGTRSRNSVDVTNSFAVPFEEDSKNPAARGGVENVKLLDARRGGCAPSASSRTFRCELDLGRAAPESARSCAINGSAGVVPRPQLS